jgi:hypothetical protein
MTYSVTTSGRLLLPEVLERQALTVLEVDLVARQGPFDDPAAADTLADLARVAGVAVRREGDWLHLATDEAGDPGWSDQSTAFYVGLARWVREGEVQLQGQDGGRWSYRFGPDGVIQIGQNGWDGSLVPFGEPVSSAAAPRTAGVGGPGVEQPRNRTFQMTLLLLVGLVLIIGIAMLGAGAFS